MAQRVFNLLQGYSDNISQYLTFSIQKQQELSENLKLISDTLLRQLIDGEAEPNVAELLELEKPVELPLPALSLNATFNVEPKSNGKASIKRTSLRLSTKASKHREPSKRITRSSFKSVDESKSLTESDSNTFMTPVTAKSCKIKLFKLEDSGIRLNSKEMLPPLTKPKTLSNTKTRSSSKKSLKPETPLKFEQNKVKTKVPSIPKIAESSDEFEPVAKKECLNATFVQSTPIAKVAKVIEPMDASYTNYEISVLRDSDDSEDGSIPTKAIPNWAISSKLKNTLLKQHHNQPDLKAFFGPIDIAPNELFGVKKSRSVVRTSSVLWGTPEKSEL